MAQRVPRSGSSYEMKSYLAASYWFFYRAAQMSKRFNVAAARSLALIRFAGSSLSSLPPRGFPFLAYYCSHSNTGGETRTINRRETASRGKYAGSAAEIMNVFTARHKEEKEREDKR